MSVLELSVSLSRIVQRMAELAAAVRLVYRCDAALLIVRQWLDKLADLERQVTGSSMNSCLSKF